MDRPRVSQETLERIYRICQGNRIHDVTVVYAQLPDVPNNVIDEGIQVWVDLGRIQADIDRQELMDGTVVAISNIRGWDVRDESPPGVEL